MKFYIGMIIDAGASAAQSHSGCSKMLDLQRLSIQLHNIRV